jgi:ribose/xylose/arabinose/galactoside ABC-type transport system permease subunit
LTSVKLPLRRVSFKQFLQSYGLVLSLLLLCVVLAAASDRFLTTSNLLNILRQAAVNGIISVGMMMVILTRGIDLSVGSVLALSTVIASDLLLRSDVPIVGTLSPLGAIFVCLLIGGLLGAVNGLLISGLRIPPFIATLGMMTFARGAALFYTGGRPITGLGDLGEGFRYLGSAVLLGVPVPIVTAALVLIGAYILLNHTPLGRYIYSLGNNEEAAFLSGLPVKRVLVFVYVVSGVLAALAGVILTGRLNSAQPTAGTFFEFDAIAAVIVGGTSFTGGIGTVWGTLVGVLIIAVINNGLNLMNVSAFYQDITKGLVIALALLLYRVIR